MALQINLDPEQPVYYPGQTLSGYVTLNLDVDSLIYKTLTVTCKGKVKCVWNKDYEREGNYLSYTETVKYIRKEPIMEESKTLFTGDSHPAGNHQYRFSFKIPDNIPSSFQGEHGFIRYFLKAFGKKSKNPVKYAFTVNDFIDTNDRKYAVGPGEQAHKNVGCLCCAAGPIDVSVGIDRGCYCPGESILINANIQNQTTKIIPKMSATLFQTITYKGVGKPESDPETGPASEEEKEKEVVNEIATLEEVDIRSGEERSWANKVMELPALPPTITNCEPLKIAYKLKMLVKVPDAFDMEMKIKVLIGTVPFMKTYGQNNGQQNSSNVIQSRHASIPGYSDIPPPLYATAVGAPSVSGEYLPFYTFAQPDAMHLTNQT